MMLALAPFAFAAATLSTPAEPAAPSIEAPAALAPIVAELRYVPLTDLVYAASEVDLSLRMDDLGLVGSAGLFGAPTPSSTPGASASEDCPKP